MIEWLIRRPVIYAFYMKHMGILHVVFDVSYSQIPMHLMLVVQKDG